MSNNLSALRSATSQTPARVLSRLYREPRVHFVAISLLLVAIVAVPLAFHRGALTARGSAEAILTAALAMLAFVSFGLSRRNCRRYRMLSERLAWRAAQEMEFVDLAQRLMAAGSSTEVARCIAVGTLGLAPVTGVYLELVLPDRAEVEIAANAGEMAPPAGSRIPFQESFSSRTANGEPAVDLSAHGGRLVAAPLLSGDDLLGALVLVVEHSQPGSPPLALSRIQIAANFAALALRRVTLIEEAEARRREIERHLESKARLIRGFTHDLKNPIGAIDGYAQILETGVKGELSWEHREYVGRIRASIRAMLRLIEDLAELARAETGELRLEPSLTNPEHLIGSIIDQYRATATAQGLVLETSIPHTLPHLNIDPDRVRQILGNLLSNAIKYTPAPGRITVRAEVSARGAGPGPQPVSCARRWLAIAVADTGPGIDPEKHGMIFDEFIRLNPAGGEGTGLGLAISRHIARAMNGEITVESGPGRGSTFTLWLPFA